MTETKTCLFAGSFDPFTLGHLDVVNQAAKVFDHIVIGIGASSTKSALFSTEEKIEIIQEVFADQSQVSVGSFSGLAIDFANSRGCSCLIRGLRTEADFSYEMPMAITNRRLTEGLGTVFFPTNSEFAYLSSSLVKELCIHNADVSHLVPASVWRQLNKKFAKSSPIA